MALSSSSPDVRPDQVKKSQSAAEPSSSEVPAVNIHTPAGSTTADTNGVEQVAPKNNGLIASTSDSQVKATSGEPGSTSSTRGAEGQAPLPPSGTSSPATAVVAPASTSDTSQKAPGTSTKEEKDSDKPENGSLAPTLTGTNAHGGSTRKKGELSSTSEGTATSASHTAHKPKVPTKTRSQKPSFLSKLFRVLIPCVPSSSNSSPIEIDDADSRTSEVPPTKEKPSSKAPEQPTSDPGPVAPPKDANPTPPERHDEASTLTALTPPPPITVSDTPIAADAEVILPPTPTTHLLPQAETEGMTSGAVVPPGSTGGNSPGGSHKRHSGVPSSHKGDGSHRGDGDESEGSSFDEDDEEMDDVNNIDEVEDEEDRLILNGGAGIPIGPVSMVYTCERTLTNHVCVQDGVPRPLLPPIAPHHAGRKCLVLDLDETLVHSSFKVPASLYVAA